MNRLFKVSVIVILLLGTTIYLPSCKKEATPPEVKATKVSDITKTTASVEGTVTDDGGAKITDFGICWSTTLYPTTSSDKTNDVSGSGTFTGSITGLIGNTRYFVRAYATNSAGTSYSNQIFFETAPFNEGSTIPALTTAEPYSITSVSAMSGGTITDDGGEDIIERGITWCTIDQFDVWDYPEVGTGVSRNGAGSGSFAGNLSSLTPGTTYFVKAFATNAVGTAYGPIFSFTTSEISPIVFNPGLTYGSVSDVDGNIYKTIQIGTQVWMAENLKTTRYNDGSFIPDITDNAEWSNLITGGYSCYNNDASAFKTIFGALYNWFAVNDNRKICPAGWHVPTDTEWTTLLTNLDGVFYSGGKLKEAGTTHWLSPNVLATNETGFTALPGGYRLAQETEFDTPASFSSIGSVGSWWSSTGLGYGEASVWSLSNQTIAFEESSTFLNNGLSVRCLKD